MTWWIVTVSPPIMSIVLEMAFLFIFESLLKISLIELYLLRRKNKHVRHIFALSLSCLGVFLLLEEMLVLGVHCGLEPGMVLIYAFFMITNASSAS
jgi:hypothetical protein